MERTYDEIFTELHKVSKKFLKACKINDKYDTAFTNRLENHWCKKYKKLELEFIQYVQNHPKQII